MRAIYLYWTGCTGKRLTGIEYGKGKLAGEKKLAPA